MEYDTLHLPFTDIIIDGHRAVGGEDGQRFPLAKRVVHCFGHGMFR